MAPPLALLLYFVLLVALIHYDPAKERINMRALWVPTVWMIILLSQLPAQWLGIAGATAAEAMEEGNWLDRAVYVILIGAAVYILAKRGLSVGDLIAANYALTLLVAFALVSAAWSDFPAIALKRWFRDLGTYLIVFVIASDRSPLTAMSTVLRRACYILVPLSVVLVKYFPGVGITYDPWTGAPSYAGVTTTKNGLGILCLVAGIFFFWDTVRRWPQRKVRRTKRIILVNLAFIGMTVWLMKLSQSVTSQVSLLVGAVVILAVHSQFGRARLTWLKIAIPCVIVFSIALEFLLDISSVIASALGRDSTMTGRTDVWQTVLPLNPNPLFGAGYESFWLGARLQAIWSVFWYRPNQAHNGYIEIYLNLGLVGLCLLAAFVIGAYRRIWRPTNTVEFVSLNLAIWMIMVLHNVTEAGVFKGAIWVLVLVASVAIPVRTMQPVREASRRTRMPATKAVSDQGH